jgi:hypothetical protein
MKTFSKIWLKSSVIVVSIAAITGILFLGEKKEFDTKMVEILQKTLVTELNKVDVSGKTDNLDNFLSLDKKFSNTKLNCNSEEEVSKYNLIINENNEIEIKICFEESEVIGFKNSTFDAIDNKEVVFNYLKKINK